MSEWKTYRLGDICKNVCSGGTPKSTEPSYYGGNIPWLNTKEVNFCRIDKTEKTITDSGFQNSSTKWIEKNSVIVAMYGATAAKVAVNMIPLTTNQACCNLTIDPNLADFRFVYFYLCYKYTSLAALANGGAQQNLNAQRIKDFDITLPPLEEQKRIADILWSLDDKIELNRRLNANLEAQAQALFRSWFVDFEPFRNGPFVDSELGKIPQGWKVGTLSEIGDVIGGGTPSKIVSEYYTDNGIAWITPKDLSTNNCKFTSKGETDISELGYKNSSAKLMPRGSVLFSSRAPIGYISIAKNEICTNQGFKSIVPKKAGTCFIYYFLRNNTSKIESMASGSTFKEASGGLMKSLEVIIPSNKILTAFEEAIQPLFNMQEHNEDENARLSALRDTLLPKLMAGEINLH